MPGVAVCPSKRWSEFPFSREREHSLKRFLLPCEKYRRYGYRTGKFSEEELLHKHEAYCKRCDAFALKPDGSLAYKQQLQCRIHPGKKQQQDQIWSCCHTTTIEYPGQPSGCRVFSRHDWTTNSALPQKFWDLHYTPQFKPSDQRKRARKAVSLDCEMATNRFDHPELIKLTLIDFFTKEVLIDAIVKPLVKIKNMITHIHGITYKDIISASNASTAILGRDAARQKIFEFVGPETMVFVHGGPNDFLCLRWLHPAIVDTQEIESRVKRIGDDELDDWLDDEGEVGVEDAKGEVHVQQAPTAIPAESTPNRLEIDRPEPITNLSPLVKEGQQFWDCKVCNLKMPKAAEQAHRTEPSHIATLLMLVQQKGG
ncbi:hypothetical protein TWF192_001946 [Orbilia oligospora]|nr:hypothetical protein TWF192_001946 [Orbilia oligospora]